MVPEFDNLPEAVEYMTGYDYSNLGEFGTFKGKRVLLVLAFSQSFTPRLLAVESRYRRKATTDALVDSIKTAGPHAAAALFHASKGNFLGAIRSFFKLSTAKGGDDEEWIESIRLLDEDVYQYAKFEDLIRTTSLCSRPHIIHTMGIAQAGPVFYGQDTQDGRQIFFYKLTS